jgi:hypothetical protein
MWLLMAILSLGWAVSSISEGNFPMAGGAGVALIFCYSMSKRKQPAKLEGDEGNEDHPVELAQGKNSLDVLREHWSHIQKDKDRGGSMVRGWYFDDITSFQLKKIKALSPPLTRQEFKSLNKGMASDVIGLSDDVDPDDLPVLKFFKVKMGKGFTQTAARIRIREFFSDPNNVELWKNRPASAMDKEQLRFYQLKASGKISQEEASKILSEFEPTEDQEMAWTSFDGIWDDLNDKDFREEYEIKKVSMKAFKEALVSLDEKGDSLLELDGDSGKVAEKLLELFPDLEKS